MLGSPQIECPWLAAFEETDLGEVQRAFQTAPACELRQHWLPNPEKEFTPATVRCGWREDALWLFADLEDVDVFTFARHANERLWELGDTLEIFLRPLGQRAYSEYHVAPNNVRLQLRFPDAQTVQRARKQDAFGEVLVPGEHFRSWTWLRPEMGSWFALLEIPARAVYDFPRPLAGAEWLFSFCRYDYTRGQQAPVISSTSALTRPDFHRQEEWGVMIFESISNAHESAFIHTRPSAS